MKSDKTSVIDIIAEDRWADELMMLREIILKHKELKEEIKWGGPIYTLNGKNVLAIGGFKKFFTIWFHNGSFLSDPEKVLVNANEERTRGLRQWRFQSMKEIKQALIKKYIAEAIANEKAGIKIKPEKKPLPAIPGEYNAAFKKDKALKDAFSKLTPGKQREYLEYVLEAKTEETRVKRVKKAIPNIKAGIGLNDKYR
ncbi:MAG: DUF1801 domain-containing protein [Saprospiraceae bacterium]